MAKQRIFGLDLMRAVAILLVVFSHITWIVPNAKGLIPNLMSIAGVYGVEIFFVLSGFLIGRIVYRIYSSEDFGFSKVFYFWIRRWFRTLPNYYLALAVNIGVAIYLGTHLPKSPWQYGFFIQNFAWQMPNFFGESWSLSIEEFAYIIGPLLLYLTLFIKSKTSKSKIFLVVTLLTICFFTITKLIYAQLDDVKTMMYWNQNVKAIVIYRIDAIYYGVLAAYISIVRPKFWNQIKYVSFVTGVILFMSINVLVPLKGIFIETHRQFWDVWYLPINSIAIAMTLPILSHMDSASQLISKPITFISLISYSMYLFHYSIILQLLKYYIPTEGLPSFDVLIYIITYLSLTILVAYIIYKLFEKPLMNLRDKPLIKNRFN